MNDQVRWDEQEIEGNLGWGLIRAYLTFLPRLAAVLAPEGITPTQFGVLVQVASAPGISQGALARLCYMTPQSMGQILPGLEARRLLVRGPRPGRGHPIPVDLTDEGRRVLERATPAVLEVNSAAAWGLTEEEGRTLGSLLHKTFGSADGLA